MKRKLIAGVLSTVLAFTMLSTGSVTEVKAEESDAKYYTAGTVTDAEGNYEICVGDKLSFEASVYLSTDDSEVTTGKWRFVTDKELLAIDGIDDTDLCYMYAPNSESETWTTFDGTIPEAAFGQVINKLYAVVVTDDDGTESKCAAYAYSKGTVHSWGGTKNVTFSLNEDGKTVSVYSIFDNGTATKIPSSIKVNGKSYKVTSIGDWAYMGTKLKSITIPSTVTTIGEEAFKDAKNLKTININGNIKSVGENAFQGINKKAVFKIKASAANYKKIVKRIKKAGAPKTATFKRVK